MLTSFIIHILKWAKSNDYYWDHYTCSNAAKNGHLEVLKWARSNGCKLSSNTCDNAALNGHLEVLMWASSNGCPWSPLIDVLAKERWPDIKV